MHQKGLLHRDVKPDNIILRQNTDEVILIDFGIAREFNTGVKQTHTGMVSEGYSPIEQYLTNAARSPATDVYGLAATLYALLTAQVPMPVLLRDREQMPTPRELQPHVSAAVNQAVMRGMSVEARYRPQTVLEWLNLLPGGKRIVIQSTPTHAVQTIDLSTTDYQPPVPEDAAAVGSVASSPVKSEKASAEFKEPWFKNKIPSPRVLIGTGVAIFGVTLGFGLTKIASTTEQQKIAPAIEQTTNEAAIEIPSVGISPPPSPSASPQETETAKEQNTATTSAATTTPARVRSNRTRRSKPARVTNTRKRRRRSNTATTKKSTTQKSASTSQTTTKKTTSTKSSQSNSSRSNSNRSRSRKPSSRNNNSSGKSQTANTNKPKPTSIPPKTVKVVPSPSLVERLRKVRDSRNQTSSPKNSIKLKPPKKINRPVVVPAPPPKQSKSSNPPAVVVPTQPVNSNTEQGE